MQRNAVAGAKASRLADLRTEVARIEAGGRKRRKPDTRGLLHRAHMAAHAVRVATDASDDGMRALAAAAGVEFWAVMWLADHDGLPSDWSPAEAAGFLDAVEGLTRGASAA